MVQGLDHVERKTGYDNDENDLVNERACENEVHVWVISVVSRDQARTKVLWQEPHGAKVYDSSSDFARDHVRVPGCNLEGDHDELVEHQCGERDGDNVQELGLEEEQREEHNRSSLVHADCEPDEESPVAQCPALVVSVIFGCEHKPLSAPYTVLDTSAPCLR